YRATSRRPLLRSSSCPLLPSRLLPSHLRRVCRRLESNSSHHPLKRVVAFLFTEGNRMITLKDVREARERIGTSVVVSRCAQSNAFTRMTGNNVWLKYENLQMTGSYKERGALNKILTLTPEERACGLVAASAGNHAQAVSHHATQRGISAQICMPL